MATILVTGANGQVGFELAHWLRPHGRVVAIDSDRRKSVVIKSTLGNTENSSGEAM